MKAHPFKQSPIKTYSSGPSPSFGAKIKKALGHVWKAISSIPSSLSHLAGRISQAVKNLFVSNENSASSKQPTGKVEASGSTDATQVFKKVVQEEDEDFDSSVIFGEEEKPKENSSDRDPLRDAGAVYSTKLEYVNPAHSDDLIPSLQRGFIASKSIWDVEEADTDLDLIAGIIQPALSSLEEVEAMEPTPDNLLIMTVKLNDEYAYLNGYRSAIEDMPQKAKESMQETITSIEKKMAEIGSAVLAPAQSALEELRDMVPVDFQDYLRFTEKLGHEKESLQRFASKFETTAPEIHFLVQGTMQELDEAISQLNKDLCEQARLHYQPNLKIGSDGSCMFHSIGHQLGHKLNDKGAEQHYRKLAADSIREHHRQLLATGDFMEIEHFETGIRDAMNSPEGKIKIDSYQTAQGGQKAWEAKLRNELKREPTEVDKYCDCMKDMKTKMWGGQNELTALTEVLKVPILVFTVGRIKIDNEWFDDPSIWTVSYVNKYSDKPAIKIYYNGSNHYVDLQPMAK